MAKPNYQHMRKQREAARKARQLEKQTRRQTKDAPATPDNTEAPVTQVTPKES